MYLAKHTIFKMSNYGMGYFTWMNQELCHNPASVCCAFTQPSYKPRGSILHNAGITVWSFFFLVCDTPRFSKSYIGMQKGLSVARQVESQQVLSRSIGSYPGISVSTVRRDKNTSWQVYYIKFLITESKYRLKIKKRTPTEQSNA